MAAEQILVNTVFILRWRTHDKRQQILQAKPEGHAKCFLQLL